MKPSFEKVAILGVGLLGGSLGLKIRNQGLAKWVVGYGRGRANLLAAKRLGQIDEIADSAESAIHDADLILLCAPVESVKRHLESVAHHAKPKTLVMDVGSTKADIMKAAARWLPGSGGIHFVGAHPMAGSERQGAQAAQEDLFQDKLCLLCFLPGTPKNIKDVAVSFWRVIGAEVSSIPPLKHDQILAWTSHLPQMTAYVLMGAVARGLSLPVIKKMSGKGLRDTSRLAASPASMWLDICKTNRKPLSQALKTLRSQLDWLIARLEKNSWSELEKFFNKVSEFRRKF